MIDKELGGRHKHVECEGLFHILSILISDWSSWFFNINNLQALSWPYTKC